MGTSEEQREIKNSSGDDGGSWDNSFLPRTGEKIPGIVEDKALVVREQSQC